MVVVDDDDGVGTDRGVYIYYLHLRFIFVSALIERGRKSKQIQKQISFIPSQLTIQLNSMDKLAK